MTIRTPQQRRILRTRRRIAARRYGRVRLSVFRSLKHIYAQLIDDDAGKTLTAASSLEKDIKGGKKEDMARKVGEIIAQRGKKAGIGKIVFDRGGYLYHGRVKTLAEAARKGGLEF